MSSPQNAHTIINELVSLGHDYFCISPGSRNTPLIYAVHKNPKAKSFVFLDERALAFHALGYAKAQKKAAVIIVTSGSALANLYPAVVEAHKESIPMIMLTADRPYFLQNCGFNQTFDQVKLFDRFVEFEANLPLMEAKHPSFLKSTLSLVSHRSLVGPTQINCQFSEPFIDWDQCSNQSSKPHLEYQSGTPYIKEMPRLKASKNGLIIACRGISDQEAIAIDALSQKLNYPIFADPLANMQKLKSPNFISYYDLILENQKLKFDVTLQFGGSLNATKNLQLNLKANPPKTYWHISKKIENQDPNFLSAKFFHSDIELFCQRLECSQDPGESQLEELIQINQEINHKLNNLCFEEKQLSEPYCVHHLLSSSMSESHTFIASSSPIRWATKYGLNNPHNRIYSNRGLSGIDGNLATAFGLSQGLDKPIKIIIGDLAFLYDLNSLMQISKLKHPVDLFVLNNQGGGIFTKFETYKDKELFEKYFQDKHSLSFEHISKQFSLEYNLIQSKEDLSQINLNERSRSRLIEIQTTTEVNMQTAQNIQNELRKTSEQNLVC